MLHTTFRKAREAGACSSEYNKMARFLGGVDKYGEDTPIPLDKILDVCGLDAALWCLQCILEPAEKEIGLLIGDFSEHTLPLLENLEKKYPDDARPRQAIETSRKFAGGELDAAQVAAWNADWAARDAAWDAEDAERQWQEKKFREMLNNSGN